MGGRRRRRVDFLGGEEFLDSVGTTLAKLRAFEGSKGEEIRKEKGDSSGEKEIKKGSFRRGKLRAKRPSIAENLDKLQSDSGEPSGTVDFQGQLFRAGSVGAVIQEIELQWQERVWQFFFVSF